MILKYSKNISSVLERFTPNGGPPSFRILLIGRSMPIKVPLFFNSLNTVSIYFILWDGGIAQKKVYSSISEIDENIDIVDIFRKSSDVDLIIDDIIKIKPSTIWLQIGIINLNAEKLAKKNKINIIMNRCPKIEYSRLSGELGWAGINSGLFYNKRKFIRPIY